MRRSGSRRSGSLPEFDRHVLWKSVLLARPPLPGAVRGAFHARCRGPEAPQALSRRVVHLGDQDVTRLAFLRLLLATPIQAVEVSLADVAVGLRNSSRRDTAASARLHFRGGAQRSERLRAWSSRSLHNTGTVSDFVMAARRSLIVASPLSKSSGLPSQPPMRAAFRSFSAVDR